MRCCDPKKTDFIFTSTIETARRELATIQLKYAFSFDVHKTEAI